MNSTMTKRIDSLYRTMKSRFKEKRNKRGHLIRAGRNLPFNIPEFRNAVMAVYPDGTTVKRCRYCNRPISFLTFCCEHKTPIKRGGSLDLDNLDFECCQPCNSRKGGLTPEEFQALLDGLQTFPEAARQDILSRLEIAVQLAAANHHLRSIARATQQTTGEI